MSPGGARSAGSGASRRPAAIVLRPWQEGDAPALVAAWRDPAIAEHCGVPPDAGPDRAEAWVGGWLERAERASPSISSWPTRRRTRSSARSDSGRSSRHRTVPRSVACSSSAGGSVRPTVEQDGPAPRCGCSRTGPSRGLGAEKLVARIRRGHVPSEAVARRAPAWCAGGTLDADCDLLGPVRCYHARLTVKWVQ